MNAFEIVEREITQELTRHGLWVGGRKCACQNWEYKSERGQARASYAAMVVAHHRHVAQIVATRLLDCGGLPRKEFLAHNGAEPTGESTPTKKPSDPTLLPSPVVAGEDTAHASYWPTKGDNLIGGGHGGCRV